MFVPFVPMFVVILALALPVELSPFTEFGLYSNGSCLGATPRACTVPGKGRAINETTGLILPSVHDWGCLAPAMSAGCGNYSTKSTQRLIRNQTVAVK